MLTTANRNINRERHDRFNGQMCFSSVSAEEFQHYNFIDIQIVTNSVVLLWEQGVEGSNPFTPTQIKFVINQAIRRKIDSEFFFYRPYFCAGFDP